MNVLFLGRNWLSCPRKMQKSAVQIGHDWAVAWAIACVHTFFLPDLFLNYGQNSTIVLR